MHEVLRQRLLRKIESLPEDQIYQVLDYIEFLEAKHGSVEIEDEVTGLQRFAERLEDGLRRRTVSPGTLREAFQLLAAADRVLSGVASAGRDLLDDLNGEVDRRRTSASEVSEGGTDGGAGSGPDADARSAEEPPGTGP